MKKILFLFVVILVLFTSCTNNVSKLTSLKWDNLSNIEQTLFNASIYDSTIIKEAIIIEDKIIIFNKQTDEFVEIINYMPPIDVIFITVGVFLILIFIGGIMAINSK